MSLVQNAVAALVEQVEHQETEVAVGEESLQLRLVYRVHISDCLQIK